MNILKWRGRQPIQEVQDTLLEIDHRDLHQLVYDISEDLIPIKSIAYMSKPSPNGKINLPYLRIWFKK